MLAITALAAAALALPAREAHAVSGCGGYAWTMCVSWTLTGSGANWQLTVTNQDPQPGDAYLREIGLGSTTNATLAIAAGSTEGWSVTNGSFGDFGFNNLVFLAMTGGVGGGAVPPGGSVLLNLTVTSGTFNPNEIGFHMISGPEGCSNKAVFNISNGISDTPLDPAVAATCGGTTIPEPATVVLLGTGMVGLLAARRRFRVRES